LKSAQLIVFTKAQTFWSSILKNVLTAPLCEPECPVDAIFSEDELPADQIEFIEINAELSEIWPNITEEKDQLPEAERILKHKR